MKSTKAEGGKNTGEHTSLPGTAKTDTFFPDWTVAGSSFFEPAIQPKIKVGPPGDKYEREADRVADAVVSTPEPSPLQRQVEEEEEEIIQMQPTEEELQLQRKCQDCEQEEKVQAKSSDSLSSNNGKSVDLGSQLESASGSGSTLPDQTRTEMEAKLGADFSDVSIHTSPEASKMNQHLGARAFTYGSDIFFNSAEFNPASQEGKHLLAHELTHVVQQKKAVKKPSAQPVKHSTTREKVQGGFFGDVWEGVKDVGEAIGGAVTSAVEAVGGAVGAAWDKATDFFGGAADWVLEGIKSLGSSIAGWLSTAGEHVWKAIQWIGIKAWEGIKWLGEFLWEKLALIGTNIWSFLSNIPVRLWRVIVHGWEGIKGVLGWAWSGLKGAAGYVWEGLKSVFTWLGEGISGAVKWLMNGIVAGYQWAVDFVGDPSLAKLWQALTGALSWAWDGLKGFAQWGWEGIKGAAVWVGKGLKAFGMWLWEGIKSGAKWAGEMLLYVLDLIGTAEALQIVWGLIFRMRKLTQAEIDASREVHPPGMIPYELIRVDDNSVISMISGAAVTTFHVLHYPKGGLSLDVVVHELTHVAQYEYVGSVYIPQALHAQAKYGRTGGVGSGSAYDYERTGSLASQRAAGKKFKDLNRESQAELVQDYYICKTTGSGTPATDCPDHIPFINDMQRGEF